MRVSKSGRMRAFGDSPDAQRKPMCTRQENDDLVGTKNRLVWPDQQQGGTEREREREREGEGERGTS